MSLFVGPSVMAAAILCLRLGWRRSSLLTTGAWALALVTLVVLADQLGMWGLSVGAVAAMGSALVVLAVEAAGSKPMSRPVKLRASVTPPRWQIEGVARRSAVFVLVVPVGFAATMLLALGAEAAARRAEWPEANRYVLALLLQPVAWAILASVQMLYQRPRGMVVPALACALAGAASWRL